MSMMQSYTEYVSIKNKLVMITNEEPGKYIDSCNERDYFSKRERERKKEWRIENS
jgi:hypothetical protein